MDTVLVRHLTLSFFVLPPATQTSLQHHNRFQRKTWTPNQVHSAIKAYAEAATPTLQQQHHTLQNPTQPIGNAIHMLGISNLSMSIPASFTGTRCFVDASTQPDQDHQFIRPAGIGVFFIDVQAQPPTKIFIKARIEQVSSVLMAETAAAAVAVQLVHLLQAHNTCIFSNCQQLVLFLNQENTTHPPDWTIKPFTQAYKNFADMGATSIRKIPRSSNSTAHSLATQALRLSATHPQWTCSSTAHLEQCSVLSALQRLSITDVLISTALCC